MKQKWVWALVAVVLCAVLYGGIALATPPQGVSNPINVHGTFEGIDAKAKTDIDLGTAADFWQARIGAKGATDV